MKQILPEMALHMVSFP